MAEWRWRSCLWVATALVACASLAAAQAPETAESGSGYRLVLVRHAEKMRGEDPELTAKGRDRAQFLATWLAEAGVQAIWSSDYQRTRQTAQPLAKQMSLDIWIYDPADQQALADLLRAQKLNALVVGHSNTIPELAALLCDCDIPPMSETDYDRGYHVVIEPGHRAWRVLDFTKLRLDRTAD